MQQQIGFMQSARSCCDQSLMIYLYQKKYNFVMTRLIKVKGLSKPVVQALALDSNNTEWLFHKEDLSNKLMLLSLQLDWKKWSFILRLLG